MSINVSMSGNFAPPDNNMITSEYKDLSNWTTYGVMTLDYTDGVNTVTFSNVIKPTFKELFNQVTGYSLNDTIYNAVISYMASNPSYTIFGFYNPSVARFYIWGAAEASESPSTSRTNYRRPAHRWICNTSGTTLVSVYQENDYTGTDTGYVSWSNFSNHWIIGTYNDVSESGGGGYNGYISKTFAVIDGEKYFLKLDAHSETGFQLLADDCVIMSSGSNSSDITIDGNASNTAKTYYQIVEADGTSLTIKFNLTSMYVAVGSVVLKISNLALFKVG